MFERKANLILLAVLGIAMAGCNQYYNYGDGLTAQKRAQVKARQSVQQSQVESVSESGTPSEHSGTAQFEHPAAAATQPADAAAIELVVHESELGTTPLGLYGQVSASTPQQIHPQDAADNLRQVTFTHEGSDFDPNIDPTGSWMVYASTRHRENSDLYRKKIGGSAVTRLTDDPGKEAMPVISPDGTRIAFASDRSGNWDIYIIDVNGGKAVQLSNDPGHDLHPSFSPDGKQLVYCSLGSQSGQWEMIVVDLDNPAPRRFIGYGLFPTWSPMDQKILFQQARKRGTRWFSVWTVDFIDGEAVAPTELAASANAACINPSWSQDGEHIVFCTVIDPSADNNSRPTQADVWIMAADGTGRVRLTGGQFANLQPTWSSDGSIYFVSNRANAGTENVWSVQPQRALKLVRPAAMTTMPQAMVPEN